MFKRFSKNPFESEGKTAMLPNESQQHPKRFPHEQKARPYHAPQSDHEEEEVPPRIFELRQRQAATHEFERQTHSEAPPTREQAPSHYREPSSQYQQHEQPETTVGEGVVFKGELNFQRLVCIHGQFEGKLVSQGKLVVGPKGIVRSDITLKEAVIEGYVEGNIQAERLELRGEAQVRGDIKAHLLSVDEGVTIVGHVQVTPQEAGEEEPLLR